MSDGIVAVTHLPTANTFTVGAGAVTAALTDDVALVIYSIEPTSGHQVGLVAVSRDSGAGNTVVMPAGSPFNMTVYGFSLLPETLDLGNGFHCFFLTSADQHLETDGYHYETKIHAIKVKLDGLTLSLPTDYLGPVSASLVPGSRAQVPTLSAGPGRWYFLPEDFFFPPDPGIGIVQATYGANGVTGWHIEPPDRIHDKVAAYDLTVPGFPIIPGSVVVEGDAVARYGTGDQVAWEATIEYDYASAIFGRLTRQYRAILLTHRVGPSNWAVDAVHKYYRIRTSAGDPSDFGPDRELGGGITLQPDGASTAVIFSQETNWHPTWDWSEDWPSHTGASFTGSGSALGGTASTFGATDHQTLVASWNLTSESGQPSTWTIDPGADGETKGMFCSDGPTGERCLADINIEDFIAPFFEVGFTHLGDGVGVYFRGTQDMSSYFWMDRHGVWFREDGVDESVWAWPGGPLRAYHSGDPSASIPDSQTLLFNIEGLFMEFYGDNPRYDIRFDFYGATGTDRYFTYDGSGWHNITDPATVRTLGDWTAVNRNEVRFGIFWDRGIADPATQVIWADGSQIDSWGSRVHAQLVTPDGVLQDDVLLPGPDRGLEDNPTMGLDSGGTARIFMLGRDNTGYEPVPVHEVTLDAAVVTSQQLLPNLYAVGAPNDWPFFGYWHKDNTGVATSFFDWPTGSPSPNIMSIYVDTSAVGKLKGAFVSFEP